MKTIVLFNIQILHKLYFCDVIVRKCDARPTFKCTAILFRKKNHGSTGGLTTILAKTNETSDNFSGKIAILTNTERVNFRPQI